MLDDPKTARRNRLLNGLDDGALNAVVADLYLREARVRDLVVEPERPIKEVFFPLSCVLSTVAEGAHGDIVEVATVGNEGMVGVPIFLHVTTTTLRTFTQVDGETLTMRAEDFRANLDREPRLREIMGRYTQALLTQISQSAACNRMHAADQRCARWLLMTHDRAERDQFNLTQEFLAQMLGVRRATVGTVAAGIADVGAIRYVRGVITVLDRQRLEERSCECYRIIQQQYERLVPPRSTREE